MKTLFQFALLSLLSLSNYAQRIDFASTFRKLDERAYFRFHYDNDYFTKKDQYYSQGITFEYVHPALSKFPLARLLYKPWKTPAQYGVNFNLFGFTPTTILSDSILHGDRPFNANISLQSHVMQTNAARKEKFTAAFSIGVMGPAAMGYEIQYNIHKWLDNPLPLGWEHQIKNDIILNYQLGYERQLLSAGKHFVLNGTAEARIGTLNNKVNGGINFMAGRFNNKFETIRTTKRKAEYYFYSQGRVNLIGYDASMQGGMFNRKSSYTIPLADVCRVTFQADAGVIANFKTFYLSYTQSFLSKEFKTGTNHRWGGMSMGFAL